VLPKLNSAATHCFPCGRLIGHLPNTQINLNRSTSALACLAN